MIPSQISVILRDSHGIAQVKSVTCNNKILRILKAHGRAHEIPEDLYHLIKKAVAIRKHLERNRKDKEQQFVIYFHFHSSHSLLYKSSPPSPFLHQTPLFLIHTPNTIFIEISYRRL